MPLDFSKIIVIDLEATCWSGKKPKGSHHDVIEFGVAVLEVKGHRDNHEEAEIHSDINDEPRCALDLKHHACQKVQHFLTFPSSNLREFFPLFHSF